MAEKKKFIQGAIKRPGALGAKARAAGMSTQEFAAAHASDSGLTGEQARFAQVLNKVRPGGKKSPVRAAAGTIAARSRDETKKTSGGYLTTASTGAVVEENPWRIDDYTPVNGPSPFAPIPDQGGTPHEVLSKIFS